MLVSDEGLPQPTCRQVPDFDVWPVDTDEGAAVRADADSMSPPVLPGEGLTQFTRL